jgi:hypothetical protein
MTGRLVVLQRHRGMASNYTCSGGCPCQPSFDSLHVYPTSCTLVPGDQETFRGEEWKKDCNNCYSYYDVLGGPWHSNDVSIATVTAGGGVVTGVSGGSTAIMLGPITRYVYNYVFHYPTWQCQAAAVHPQCGSTANVVTITGPQTVWWFDGQTPGGYDTTVTLTALPSGASSYSWSLLAGTDKAVLSGQSGNTIHLTGNDLSTSLNDVTVQVTVTTTGGTKLATRTATVRGPYRLVPGVPVPPQPDANYGYVSYIPYTIQDNLGQELPNVGVNESLGTVINDFPGSTWIRGPATGYLPPGATFSDIIQGQAVSPPPYPYPEQPPEPPAPLGTTAVHHFAQSWFIGSETPGSGARVQTDTLQRYLDHAAHLNVVSPAP